MTADHPVLLVVPSEVNLNVNAPVVEVKEKGADRDPQQTAILYPDATEYPSYTINESRLCCVEKLLKVTFKHLSGLEDTKVCVMFKLWP